MAVKKPLVLNSTGISEELQSGDAINIDASDITSGTVATARLGTGTANSTTFLRGDQTWATPTGGGGGSSPVVTVFTSSGTYTNPQTGIVRFTVYGGGGGGGAGRRGPSGETSYGGGRGGAGGGGVVTFDASTLPASIAIWIGAGGNGGAAQTVNTTNGASGISGGDTLVGGNGTFTDSNTILSFDAGGPGGFGGTASSNGSGQTKFFDYENTTYSANVLGSQGSSQLNPSSSLLIVNYPTTPGGFGGGITNTNLPNNGGPSARQMMRSQGFNIIATQNGGTAPGGDGVTGSTVYNKRGHYVSTGGSGGAAGDAGATVAGGAGGAGGVASGGAGGGASRNGIASGAGGNGGNGIVIIEHWA